jgi:hypothetical protein
MSLRLHFQWCWLNATVNRLQWNNKNTEKCWNLSDFNVVSLVGDLFQKEIKTGPFSAQISGLLRHFLSEIFAPGPAKFASEISIRLALKHFWQPWECSDFCH